MSAVERRYVELLKSALLNEFGLEAEAAYHALQDAADAGDVAPRLVALDPPGQAPALWAQLREDRHLGRYFRDDLSRIGFSYTMVSRRRLDDLDFCVRDVLDSDVSGDLVECGVWRGGASILMRGVLASRDVLDRSVVLCDSFAGLPAPTHPEDEALDLRADLRPELVVPRERVEAHFARFGLLDEQVRFVEGTFAESLPDAPVQQIAVLRLDGDYFASTMDALVALYDKVEPGGWIIVDDFHLAPCARAVSAFRADRDIQDDMIDVDWTAVRWRKSA